MIAGEGRARCAAWPQTRLGCAVRSRVLCGSRSKSCLPAIRAAVMRSATRVRIDLTAILYGRQVIIMQVAIDTSITYRVEDMPGASRWVNLALTPQVKHATGNVVKVISSSHLLSAPVMPKTLKCCLEMKYRVFSVHLNMPDTVVKCDSESVGSVCAVDNPCWPLVYRLPDRKYIMRFSHH